MKIFGAQSEPFSAIRRRALTQAGAQVAVSAPFLGLTEADLTPAVQQAIRTLIAEVDDLRGEVSRLKARLTEMEGLADRDVLTPLLNRRALLREIRRSGTFSQRYGSSACLLYFDLDGFKAINDRFGHAAGDLMLKSIADRFVSQLRQTDVVARIGGDEFAVILVQADLATAQVKGESLKRAIEDQPYDLGDWSAPIRVTHGVVVLDPALEPEAMLAAADQAMYQRKRQKDA